MQQLAAMQLHVHQEAQYLQLPANSGPTIIFFVFS
jgi:hypothetical protein